MSWLEFAEKLKTPIRSSETYQEYIDSTKAKQAQLKDVGGFVGGTFKPERRKAAYAQGRDLITLDLDSIPSGKTDDVLKRVGGLGCAAVIYSTRKHHGFQPRLRVIIPTDRTVSPDEYEPIARKMGHLIGMDMCDPTTFEVSRLMYWPSVSSDGEYVYQLFDKSFMSADGILAMYEDWHDYSAWPQVPGIESVTKRDVAKQADPYTKKGIVGAFCRAYSIEEAMDKYIPDLYTPTKDPNRYTFTGGSTAGGAIIYDGKFLYSHHATDPCSGQLVNAFDLIRLHKFADQDLEAKEGTPVIRMPSYTAMIELARQDDTVGRLMAEERREEAVKAFGEGAAIEQQTEPQETDWTKRLQLDSNGNVKKTINNAVLVLENDPNLKDKIVVDEFASCGLTLG
ncbi:MAG: virulence-associated protein E, partial [Firmicutes bacterium]|nr:virulence-associated protein E [Bacillota bacterium]